MLRIEVQSAPQQIRRLRRPDERFQLRMSIRLQVDRRSNATTREPRRRAMKVMLILKTTPQLEAGEMPDPADAAAMENFNHEMQKAGILLDANGLKPSKHGARVTYAGVHRSVVDGPFTETKELIAGYWMIQVKDMAEAIEWAKRLPFGHGVANGREPAVEIRPVWDFEDFAKP
jgi:hypothetical protein